MATIRTTTVNTNATLAQFKAWATTLGGPTGAFATFGFVQTNDTGQIVWDATVFTLTQVAVAGAVSTYSFSSYTGPAPRIGMSVVITGFVTGGNNVTATITGLTGTTSGTFTVVTSTQANETHAGSATTTAVAASPGTGTFAGYEIWRMNDSLQATLPCFFKIEYGTGSNANASNLKVTLGLGSNGAGTLTSAATAVDYSVNNGTVVADTTGRDTLLSGDSGRFQMIWARDSSTLANRWILSIERSCDSTGVPNGDFVIAHMVSASSMKSQWIRATGSVGTQRTGAECASNSDASTASGGYIALFGIRPVIGYERNPLLGIVRGAAGDWSETDVVSLALYPGVYHTYFCTKTTNGFAPNGSTTSNAILVRYE